MLEQEQKVCDVCRVRPATQHSFNGHTGEVRGVCITCFEQTASERELEIYRESGEALRAAKCKYCGAPAVGGSGTCMPGILEEGMEYWCEPCRLDLVEFANQPENDIPEFPFDDGAAEERFSKQMEDRERRLEEFMRKRVGERIQR